MTELTEQLTSALADRYVIERVAPAPKGGLGAARCVVNDATDAERGLQPRNDMARLGGR
jgi:hypothetical protein